MARGIEIKCTEDTEIATGVPGTVHERDLLFIPFKSDDEKMVQMVKNFFVKMSDNILNMQDESERKLVLRLSEMNKKMDKIEQMEFNSQAISELEKNYKHLSVIIEKEVSEYRRELARKIKKMNADEIDAKFTVIFQEIERLKDDNRKIASSQSDIGGRR